MNDKNIKNHIKIKEIEKTEMLHFLEMVNDLNKEIGLSDATYKECLVKIASRIAQCDISIQDHEKLLN